MTVKSILRRRWWAVEIRDPIFYRIPVYINSSCMYTIVIEYIESSELMGRGLGAVVVDPLWRECPTRTA
ncbi:hypothetical protein EVAR_103541_1 [Eumeta japonica]|uniref:Uncharacterized protein n=1 Tax=Eumeta variegata TaxID=151549 RepID=A0A4C1YF76_EUMVA|nr:hypothetical protein EVAR_103541_1 [Eumeta japonica]